MTKEQSVKETIGQRDKLSRRQVDKGTKCQVDSETRGQSVKETRGRDVKDFRSNVTTRVVNTLTEGNSLMVIGEPGAGKTYLAKLVHRETDAAYTVYAGSIKGCLSAIADSLQCPTENEEGKSMTTDQLKKEIGLNINDTILICDNIHRFPASLKYWLENLYENGATMLLLGTKRDLQGVSFKLPRIKLEPLTDSQIRAVIWQEVASRGMQLSSHKVAELAGRSAGNPMLAKRLVDEVESGIDDENLNDGDAYLDITPALMAMAGVLAGVRFIGLALNDRSLYIIGGLSLAVFICIRYLRQLLPKDDRRK